MANAIDIRAVTKTFPGVVALDGVSFGVEAGTVHAVVGENGAGKSTLMKILGGVYHPDRGEILVGGKRAHIRSVQDAVAHGISVIYQELNLMPELSVAENIFVADLPTARYLPLVRPRRLEARAAELLGRLDLGLESGHPGEAPQRLAAPDGGDRQGAPPRRLESSSWTSPPRPSPGPRWRSSSRSSGRFARRARPSSTSRTG